MEAFGGKRPAGPANTAEVLSSYWKQSRDNVSKHCDRPYEAGQSKHSLKIKNWAHPAMERVWTRSARGASREALFV
jgi:hypothetical protein